MKKLVLPNIILLFSSALLSAQTPNWSTDVASIIYDNCSVCHHQGAIAPFPLMSYEDAVLNAFSIQVQVNAKAMPPWPPDPNYNHLGFEKVLTDDELATINAWVDGGMPSGDLGTAPPPPVFDGALVMQNPDDTIQLPLFEITSNSDVYRSFVIPSGYTETKYINQIEFVPGDQSLVHHAIYYQDTSKESYESDSAFDGPGFPTYATGAKSKYAVNFGGWIPGLGVLKFPPNMGLEIPPGADIVVAIHYPPYNLGKVDSSKVYFKFCDVPDVRPIYQERYLYGSAPSLINGPLYIEANTTKTFFEKSGAVDADKSLVGLAPHSHLICRSWKVTMVPEVGADSTKLLYIPTWDFGWQYSYLLTKVMKIPSGAKFYGESFFDNTLNNPDNPNNPPEDVKAGQSTLDEMMACRFWVMDYQPGDENIILDSAFYGLPTGSQVIPDVESIRVFPNPSGTTIHFTTTLSENDITWSMYDSFGTVVRTDHERNIPKGLYADEIDVSDLASGIYLLKIQSGNEASVQKVIVAR